MQAELVAILMALEHVEQAVEGPVFVHNDSMFALQPITRHHCSHNVRLLTYIWRTLEALESVGRRATLIWLAGH